jgi:hypothetical protein
LLNIQVARALSGVRKRNCSRGTNHRRALAAAMRAVAFDRLLELAVDLEGDVAAVATAPVCWHDALR